MATPVPVTVTITSVGCTQNDECDAAGIEAAGNRAERLDGIGDRR